VLVLEVFGVDEDDVFDVALLVALDAALVALEVALLVVCCVVWFVAVLVEQGDNVCHHV
jgi:hypothetical protein